MDNQKTATLQVSFNQKFDQQSIGRKVAHSSLDLIEIPKGTLIKIDGIPFELKNDTQVIGNKENLSLTKTDEKVGKL